MSAANYIHTPKRKTPVHLHWLALPLMASVGAHMVLLLTFGTLGFFEIDSFEKEIDKIFTLETGTIRPQDLERIAIAPDLPPEELLTVQNVGTLKPTELPDYIDRAPDAMPGRLQPRYPEEELPIISAQGVSDRSRAFVRDGELDAVTPDHNAPDVVSSGRKIMRQTKVTKLPPDVAETVEKIAQSMPGRDERAPEGTAPRVALAPPASFGVAPSSEMSKLPRDAESLFSSAKTSEQIEPIELEVDLDILAGSSGEHHFFRMTLRRRKEDTLPPIQKNVLFLVDISGSIKLDMLSQIQQALARSGETFNKGDSFNVMRFSEKTFSEFEGFVPANKENLERAAKSVQKEPGQIRTDVYSAINEVVMTLKEEAKPISIIVISDGNPTSGIHDIRHIVNDLSSSSRPNHSIFPFNPGSGSANEYLLDLLAYRNRGQFVQSKGGNEISFDLLGLLRQHKDPILTGLRAQYGNFEADEIYPQTLPNLYAGKPVVIYGRCRPGESIAVQVMGQSARGKKSFLYTNTLPKVSSTDRTIEREWARGKIHYLAALIAREGEASEYTDEIKRLSQKYGLASPYSE